MPVGFFSVRPRREAGGPRPRASPRRRCRPPPTRRLPRRCLGSPRSPGAPGSPGSSWSSSLLLSPSLSWFLTAGFPISLLPVFSRLWLLPSSAVPQLPCWPAGPTAACRASRPCCPSLYYPACPLSLYGTDESSGARQFPIHRSRSWLDRDPRRTCPSIYVASSARPVGAPGPGDRWRDGSGTRLWGGHALCLLPAGLCALPRRGALRPRCAPERRPVAERGNGDRVGLPQR